MSLRGQAVRTAILALFLAAGLLAAAPDQSISSYPASFFADSQPRTAYDMVSRLPGFTLDTGATARGFAGTAGNVLVDGIRPTAKTDDLSSILTRIPASEVERIDLIRGGAPGMDMHGQSVVANVIRRTGDSSSTVVTAAGVFAGNGTAAPKVRVEFHGKSGTLRYEASLAHTADIWDDAPGKGYRVVTTPGGIPQYDLTERRGILRVGWAANGAITLPLWGGEWNNNATLQTTDTPSSVLYSGSGGSRFDTITRLRNAELGSHWERTIGRLDLEGLVLQRLGHEADSNTSAEPSGDATFLGTNDTGESIGRLSARYAISPRLDLRTGGEAAYNTLDGHSSFVSAGVPVSLPNANLKVNEKRGEVFAETRWKIAETLEMEAGARMEFSTISESGDSSLTRSFFYPKPRLLLTWTPQPDSQLRLRAEKVVGQLNFTDFVASSNLAGFGVAAGNSNLRPEQRWQFQLTGEQHFWQKGDLVVDLLHEEISDLQDFIPVGGGLDAPGNIPHAVSDQIMITSSIPLDRLGLTNGLLKPNVYWDSSSLVDPVTGQVRRISNQVSRHIFFEVDQDLLKWDSSWALGFSPAGFSRTTYRIAQISKIGIHNPYLYASWTWKPTTDWSLRLQLDNALPYRFEETQWNYPGPRAPGLAPTLQRAFDRTEPRLVIEIRKTL